MVAEWAGVAFTVALMMTKEEGGLHLFNKVCKCRKVG